MRKTLVSLAVVLFLPAAPAAASAQPFGSLGSSEDSSPVVPVAHAPNPLEVDTIEQLNRHLEEHIPTIPESIRPTSTVTLTRDSEVSRLAQEGASKALALFMTFDQRHERAWESPQILDDNAGFKDAVVCGPGPLTAVRIGDAYRAVGSYDGMTSDLHVVRPFTLYQYPDPLVGVGYAERNGEACSYTLLRSANYPFL